MMRRIEYANLYVEKFAGDILLLDFTREDEFTFFQNFGDYNQQIKLKEYTPSMLLLKNIKDVSLAEGDIIKVSMDVLIKHSIEKRKKSDNVVINDEPYNIYMSFDDGSWFVHLLITGEAVRNNYVSKRLVSYIEQTWEEGSPCSLDDARGEINIEVMDVGQGSTGLIYNNHDLTIFDFGASMFASKQELRDYVSKVKSKHGSFYGVSLIISHWDCDHYNLLTVLKEEELREFCCIFAPREVISLTAKQVVRMLSDNCKNIRTFSSPIPKAKREIGMLPLIVKSNYTLYIGEKSKSINKSGLALMVKTNTEVTILTADHTNKQIVEYICKDISHNRSCKCLNIVVPHHGGNCGELRISHFSEKTGIAAISVGKNNYKHPSQSMIDVYESLGFNVKRTDWERKNIIISMS